MVSLRLVHANLREFLEAELPAINAGELADCETLIAIDHLFCDITHLVFVRPKDRIGRCLPDFWSPVQRASEWIAQASAMLDVGGLMKKELLRLGVGTSDVPTWLLQFYGADSYSNPDKDIGYRCASVIMPSHQVEPVYDFLSRWFAQLAEYTFIECSEKDALAYSESALDFGTDYDLLCYPFAQGIFGRWHGEEGLLFRLKRKVAELESGGGRSLSVPPFYLTHSHVPGSGREIFFSKRAKDYLLANSFEHRDSARPVNLEILDLIYCLQCRLIRLLDWPQFFVNAKEKLPKEQAFAANHPMTLGLPYDPFVELSEYLASQRKKYPILEESPYTADAFDRSPLSR